MLFSSLGVRQDQSQKGQEGHSQETAGSSQEEEGETRGQREVQIFGKGVTKGKLCHEVQIIFYTLMSG